MGDRLEVLGYDAWISIDLRCFDLQSPDYGVGAYFQRLGFLPQVLLLHETNLDQIHLHALPLDDTLLDYAWVAQRGMPGGQR